MKIVVLNHRFRISKPGSYLIDALRTTWTEQGHSVKFVCAVLRPPPPADVAVQHVDQTVVPEGYRLACRRFPVVVNGAVNDISKSVFSRVIVKRDDAYDGPVIIKTEENSGGRVEYRLRRAQGMTSELRRRRGWRWKRRLRKYMVLDSPRDVPAGVWDNRHLIVERFLPEVDADGHYNLRIWLFLGDREVHYRCVSGEPLVKSENTLRREDLPLDDVPDELRDVRRRLGIDFGKFDYAMVGGKPVLFDVNKTPSVPANFKADPAVVNKLQHLSEGILCFAR